MYALFLLAGCPTTEDTGKPTDTADTSDTSDTQDTTDTTDTGTDTTAEAVWTADGVTVTITNGTDDQGYDLGLVQTGVADGWAGEDCLGSIPAGYEDLVDGGYQYCHHVTQTGGSLSTVDTVEEIVQGSTTLLSMSMEAQLTYAIFEAGSSACWAWGEEPAYYDGTACTAL